MKQLKHKYWLSSTTLYDADGNPIDQRNRWDIMSEVKNPAKFIEREGQYHEFEVSFFFVFGRGQVLVDEKTYWNYRIGDWIKDEAQNELSSFNCICPNCNDNRIKKRSLIYQKKAFCNENCFKQWQAEQKENFKVDSV